MEVHLTEEEYRHLKWQVSNSELKTEPFIRALIMGTTIILAILIVVMNLISDILYKIVDPRITLE